jgi:hypothetical protein
MEERTREVPSLVLKTKGTSGMESVTTPLPPLIFYVDRKYVAYAREMKSPAIFIADKGLVTRPVS